MLPRLQAEERLNAIGDRAAAMWLDDRDAAKQLLGALETDAQIVRPRAVRASPAMLAKMGIGLRMPTEASKEAPSDG